MPETSHSPTEFHWFLDRDSMMAYVFDEMTASLEQDISEQEACGDVETAGELRAKLADIMTHWPASDR